MPESHTSAIFGVPLQVALVLVGLTVAFGLAAGLPWLSKYGRQAWSRGTLVPHPSQPGSMLLFVALPTLFYLGRLTFLVLTVIVPTGLVNSPDNRLLRFDEPADVEVTGWETGTLRYPENTAELTARAAGRMKAKDPWCRARAARDVAWWTSVCPNYSQFTIPILLRAVHDPDPGVRSAAVQGLGSIGGNASAAIPGLVAARGSSVKYFDFLLQEAVFLIEHSATWPPAAECQSTTTEELERRAVQQGDEADSLQDR